MFLGELIEFSLVIEISADRYEAACPLAFYILTILQE